MPRDCATFRINAELAKTFCEISCFTRAVFVKTECLLFCYFQAFQGGEPLLLAATSSK